MVIQLLTNYCIASIFCLGKDDNQQDGWKPKAGFIWWSIGQKISLEISIIFLSWSAFFMGSTKMSYGDEFFLHFFPSSINSVNAPHTGWVGGVCRGAFAPNIDTGKHRNKEEAKCVFVKERVRACMCVCLVRISTRFMTVWSNRDFGHKSSSTSEREHTFLANLSLSFSLSLLLSLSRSFYLRLFHSLATSAQALWRMGAVWIGCVCVCVYVCVCVCVCVWKRRVGTKAEKIVRYIFINNKKEARKKRDTVKVCTAINKSVARRTLMLPFPVFGTC